ncbi:MAG: alpha/beta fold hydrolase [Gammaproteobacteria bacterium]|nr:alpha/beta fold hydrolase [Gammaproteobacteria bacterium]
MLLNYKIEGNGEPVVLIHGLFGALDNLGALARYLSQSFQVISVDLVNHGLSKHQSETNYSSMASDVIALLDSLSLDQVSVVGHSMGGKVAMELALAYSNRIAALVVADIAPVSYSNRHGLVFKGLKSVDLINLKNRKQAQQVLEQAGIETGVSLFLLKNLVKTASGFGWRFNLDAIEQAYPAIIGSLPSKGQYQGPTLFIKGELSDYITAEHRPEIMKYFPAATAKIIQGTSHWLHAEKPSAFNKIVLNFIEKYHNN